MDSGPNAPMVPSSAISAVPAVAVATAPSALFVSGEIRLILLPDFTDAAGH
jgi:hypothetical protein